MDFFINEIDKLFPSELAEEKKGRLRDGLKQFKENNQNREKYYTEFYSSKPYSFFLQGDLISEIRFPYFDFDSKTYQKEYYDALIISNTCDIDETNQANRKVNKNVLLVKLITVEDFITSLEESSIQNTEEILTQVKNQLFSNVLYLPFNDSNQKEYLAYLDDISVISIEELATLKEDIQDNKLATLDFFGYYLFVFKLSFHLNRLPEETHR